ncbi:unnamed protein product, partial [Laminaria digitata]
DDGFDFFRFFAGELLGWALSYLPCFVGARDVLCVTLSPRSVFACFAGGKRSLCVYFTRDRYMIPLLVCSLGGPDYSLDPRVLCSRVSGCFDVPCVTGLASFCFGRHVDECFIHV